MGPPAQAIIGLGANIGDPPAQLRDALAALAATPAIGSLVASSLYRTPPWGPVPQPSFVNAVALVETTLGPRALLQRLLEIERAAGRVRDMRWGPRRLDLDLLAYGDQTIDEPGLSVPHPRLHERAFVLLPLAEIAPGLVLPGRGRVADLLAGVDCGGVERIG